MERNKSIAASTTLNGMLKRITRHVHHNAVSAIGTDSRPARFHSVAGAARVAYRDAVLGATVQGRTIVGLVNALVLVTAVAAVGRSIRSCVIAFFLAAPALAFQLLSFQTGEPGYGALHRGFGAVFYAFALAHLLYYVLHQDSITADKLYGAVAAYIMIAVLWACLYDVVQYFYPGAYAFGGAVQILDMPDLIYFSFAVLTTTGFGDFAPVVIQSRFLAILEQITGTMYVAILIARLTSVYPLVATKPRAEGKTGRILLSICRSKS